MFKIYKNNDPDYVSYNHTVLVLDGVMIMFRSDGDINCLWGMPTELFDRAVSVYEEMP